MLITKNKKEEADNFTILWELKMHCVEASKSFWRRWIKVIYRERTLDIIPKHSFLGFSFFTLCHNNMMYMIYELSLDQMLHYLPFWISKIIHRFMVLLFLPLTFLVIVGYRTVRQAEVGDTVFTWFFPKLESAPTMVFWVRAVGIPHCCCPLAISFTSWLWRTSVDALRANHFAKRSPVVSVELAMAKQSNGISRPEHYIIQLIHGMSASYGVEIYYSYGIVVCKYIIKITHRQRIIEIWLYSFCKWFIDTTSFLWCESRFSPISLIIKNMH